MHVVIEKARKSAGISGMKKNYPDDPKQRGCGYWAAFLGSLSNDLGRIDAERLDSSKKVEEDVRHWAERVDELDAEITRLRRLLQERGIEVIRQQEGWPVEKGRHLLETIAG